MASNQFAPIKKQSISLVLLSVFFLALAIPAPVQADVPPSAIPSLPEFIESVKDGSISTLRGVYVQDVMAYAIDQQPSGSPGYVSGAGDKVTQFKMASAYGTLGLLAHNYLAGASFQHIERGDVITLVYGNGSTRSFLVTEILRYQALTPLSPYSNFTDLETQEFLTTEQVFKKVYSGDFHLTLQTCIENEGNLSWGRLFVIGMPVSEKLLDNLN